MTPEVTECPNCNTKLKSGLLSSVKLLSDNKRDIINEYSEKKATGYCSKCGDAPYNTHKYKVLNEVSELTTKIQNTIKALPVVSIQSPLHWDYEVLTMVTGQSTTGTGVVSEFSSSFTDMFGAQSGRYNKKLKAGEEICYTQLRKQTLDMGGNAIIATDIDYSEVGGEKGMLMVCMAGTAIKLKNPSILGADRASMLEQLAQLNDRIRHLNTLDTNE